MPLYEYRCTSCGHRFEKIQKINDAPETACPKCGGELVRPLTAPALQFKGAGWYVNDYAAKPSGGSGADSGPAKSDSKSGSDSLQLRQNAPPRGAGRDLSLAPWGHCGG